MSYYSPNADGSGDGCRNRIIEWACALMLLNFGVTCLIWPGTIGSGAFRYMLLTGITPPIFSWLCLLVGFARVMALAFNGRGLPWSARIRATTAILGGIIFGVMAWCLGFLIKDTQNFSLSVGVYAILAGMEVFTTLRAGADVNESYTQGNNGSGRSVIARIVTNDTTDSEPSGLSATRHQDARS